MSTRESSVAGGASLDVQLESLSLSSLPPSWTASTSPSSSTLHHGHQIPSSSNSSSPSSNLHQMSIQNQHTPGGQSGVVVPNAAQSTDMDSSGLGVKMAEYVLGTPPKECPLSLQSPDEFSFANAIQQAANHASHHHITSMAPSHSCSNHSPPGSAAGNSSGGPASSSPYYSPYGPPGPQPQHMPSHGQVVSSNPDMCGGLAAPPQPAGGVNGIVQAAPPAVPNAYLANLLTNYFTTLTPGSHPASNGMHTPPSAYSAAAAAVYHASHSYVDGPMRYGWTPPPPPPPPPPPQSMSHPPSSPYSASSMSLPLNSPAPFDPMRGRVGGGGGPSFAAGWPSPQRMNPKVCVSKKKNETKLIKEFKSNRYPDLELRDLHGHVIEFAQDQQGSRFIQHKLESASQPEKQMIFNEIFTWVYSLMTHEFGNYVVQKLFDFGSEEQKLALAGKMASHIVNLTMHIYGCRVMQKALVSLPPEVRKKLIDELRGHVVHCANDENGNHVMQKCFETIEPGYLQFIVDECLGKVRQLCSHSYACRVIQRLLEYCKFEQSIPVLQEIHANVLDLAQDQYGNYVIQYILQHGLPKDKSAIIQSIRGNVVPLSCHKYASNVLEKCVTHGSSLERTVLMEEVCATKDGIFKMMKDPFANYVVQRMVEVADQHYSKLLVQKIALNKDQLQKSTSGKHALAKLEKYLYKYLSGSTTTSSTSSSSSSNITGNNNNTNNNNQNNNSQQSNQQMHNNNINQNQTGGVVNNLQNLSSSHGLSSSMSSGCMHNNNALNGVVPQNSQTRDSERCQSVSVVSTGQSGLAQSCSQ